MAWQAKIIISNFFLSFYNFLPFALIILIIIVDYDMMTFEMQRSAMQNNMAMECQFLSIDTTKLNNYKTVVGQNKLKATNATSSLLK